MDGIYVAGVVHPDEVGCEPYDLTNIYITKCYNFMQLTIAIHFHKYPMSLSLYDIYLKHCINVKLVNVKSLKIFFTGSQLLKVYGKKQNSANHLYSPSSCRGGNIFLLDTVSSMKPHHLLPGR